jgi:hypothetical protein
MWIWMGGRKVGFFLIFFFLRGGMSGDEWSVLGMGMGSGVCALRDRSVSSSHRGTRRWEEHRGGHQALRRWDVWMRVSSTHPYRYPRPRRARSMGRGRQEIARLASVLGGSSSGRSHRRYAHPPLATLHTTHDPPDEPN